jgi:hypothetical protein
VRNVTFRDMVFGWKAGGSKAFLLHINQEYRPDNPNKTLSTFANISLVNVRVTTAVSDCVPRTRRVCGHRT